MKLSLKKKAVIFIVAIVAITSLVAITSFYKSLSGSIELQYREQAIDLSTTVAKAVDGDKVRVLNEAVYKIYSEMPESERLSSSHYDEEAYKEYVSKYSSVEKLPEFRETREILRSIMNNSHVYDLCIEYPIEEDQVLIYLVDGSYDADFTSRPGEFDEMYDYDLKIFDDPEAGFDPDITSTEEYGNLLVGSMPIHDSEGNIVGYAEVDYDMNSIVASEKSYARLMACILGTLAVILCFIGIRLIDRKVIQPINRLSEASVRYYNTPEGEKRTRFSELGIHTGDEIETLANSMAQMEQDIDNHIENLLRTRNELDTTREYAEEMDKLASIDPLTGVRNKRAYEEAIVGLEADIKKGSADFGIAVIDMNDLKKFNDSYGHDKGDISIKTVCGAICSVFKHSPVFRYGGDEFVVILRGHDYEHIEDLTERFGIETEYLRNKSGADPWERISAAIGYALFSPAADSGVDSVFKRADVAMYRNKKAMKETAKKAAYE